MSIDLFDKLGFELSHKIDAVLTMQDILKINKVQVFMHLNNPGVSEAIQEFKRKIAYEKHCPPFWEYKSKNGRPVLQWNNPQFGSHRDEYIRHLGLPRLRSIPIDSWVRHNARGRIHLEMDRQVSPLAHDR